MKYSIITINYNNRYGLRKTIESVVNQTYKDFEFIIIDGGSTDGSVDVIKEYSDKIDYWVSEPDKGIYNAMNKGVLQAHGEYLNFMNSGDCFYNKEVLCDASNYNGDILSGNIFRNDIEKIVYYNSDVSFKTLCSEFNHQGLFFHKSIFKKRLYDETFKIVSDWKLVLEATLIDNFSYKHIDIVVARYEAGGLSSNADMIKREKDIVLKEMLHPLIEKDYEKWNTIHNDYVDCLYQLQKHYRINHFCLSIVKLITNIVRKIKR